MEKANDNSPKSSTDKTLVKILIINNEPIIENICPVIIQKLSLNIDLLILLKLTIIYTA